MGWSTRKDWDTSELSWAKVSDWMWRSSRFPIRVVQHEKMPFLSQPQKSKLHETKGGGANTLFTCLVHTDFA